MRISKSRLLGTTALAAAVSLAAGAALAEEKAAEEEMMKAVPNHMTVGGFFNHSTHFANQDAHDGNNRGNISSRNNIEVFIGLNGELENGLKVGGRIELEGTGGAPGADESWLDVSSGWGMVRAGYMQSGRFGAAASVNAPAAAYGVNSGASHFWFDDSVENYRFEATLGSVNTDIGGNQPTLTYYTPRFNGFQLTGSYRYRIGAGGSYGRVANEDTEYTNAVDGSVHYSGAVGGVGVDMMLGAAGASAPNNGGPCGMDDYRALNAGIRLAAQGFTVGAQVADVDDEMRCGTGTSMHVGAMYGQGPWSVSVNAFDGSVEQTAAPGDAEYTAWALGFGYTIGPGLRAVAAYQDADMDGEGNADNAGQAVMVGINVGF